ncbi:MAG TPA: hypothetical protein VNL36_08410 [Bacteroidota bacterium]|nr:hypothetical protein [Bacteroidota bacterium]
MNEERTLGEQLQQETRICPQCGYAVIFPLVERCPRCFALLPALNLFCSGCIHSPTCPVKEVKTMELRGTK